MIRWVERGSRVGELILLCLFCSLLQQIGDAELEQELGITNTLHRMKLKLAVQEILSVTNNTKSHRTVSREWVWPEGRNSIS